MLAIIDKDHSPNNAERLTSLLYKITMAWGVQDGHIFTWPHALGKLMGHLSMSDVHHLFKSSVDHGVYQWLHHQTRQLTSDV